MQLLRVLGVKIDQKGHTHLIWGWAAVIRRATCEWVAGSCQIRENHPR